MNGKQSKKLRQLYRRDLRQEVEKQAEKNAEVIRNHIAALQQDLDKMLKPAPVWIPDFVWVSLQKLFLNI